MTLIVYMNREVKIVARSLTPPDLQVDSGSGPSSGISVVCVFINLEMGVTE